MDTTAIIETIDAEIDRHEKVRSLLSSDGTAPRSPSRKPQARKVSAEAWERMAVAQRARWAKVKK